jgi:hypothetical protein
MDQEFTYSKIKPAEMDSALKQFGRFQIRLSAWHSEACISFIDTCFIARDFGKHDEGAIARIAFLLLGWYTTIRMSIFHRRLICLSYILILEKPDITWSQQTNGDFVFSFKKYGGY